jgi:membrane-bound metal-dependent hydrolase YbcI (DUF457 family)
MTGKTHQSIGLLAVSAYYLSSVPTEYSPATLGFVVAGSYLGALLPDIDQPAGKLWQDLPYGHTLGRLSNPFLEHRNITHSLLGFILVGFGLYYLTQSIPDYWGVNAWTVFVSLMLAYISHLVSDMFTEMGIPLFYPYRGFFGIPPRPFQRVRIMTGKWFENLIIFPIINIATIVFIYLNWDKIKIILFK